EFVFKRCQELWRRDRAASLNRVRDRLVPVPLVTLVGFCEDCVLKPKHLAWNDKLRVCLRVDTFAKVNRYRLPINTHGMGVPPLSVTRRAAIRSRADWSVEGTGAPQLR